MNRERLRSDYWVSEHIVAQLRGLLDRAPLAGSRAGGQDHRGRQAPRRLFEQQSPCYEQGPSAVPSPRPRPVLWSRLTASGCSSWADLAHDPSSARSWPVGKHRACLVPQKSFNNPDDTTRAKKYSETRKNRPGLSAARRVDTSGFTGT